MADPAAQITRVYDPSVQSGAHTFMRDRLRVLRAVYGGTETMRAMGEEFLPRYAKESHAKYQVRKKEARLRRNMFRQAVDRITGRIFEVPAKLNPPDGQEELSPEAEAFADDADRRGKSLDRCARVLYKEALKLGMMHVLVDYPVVQAENLAQERAQAARPYLVLLYPEQVIRCYEEQETGRVLHLAWMETTVEYDRVLNQEVQVRRVHERWPGLATTWVDRPARPPQATGGPGTATTGWVKEGQDRPVVIPGTEPRRIMFHTLYAEKEDHMVGRTPLTEVADLTIEHYQIASEYRNALKHNLFPILTAVGVEQKDLQGGQTVMGPETILGSTNPEAKFAMLEHNGIALKAGFDDLESLEQRAEAYAGRLTKASGDVKATTEAISSAEVSSFARDMALELQDVLQYAVDDCAVWLGVKSLGRVDINLDFAVDLPDGDVQILQSARANGDLSRETLWKELTRRNVLSRDFDAVEEAKLLEQQEAEAMDREREAMRFASSLEQTNAPPGGE